MCLLGRLRDVCCSLFLIHIQDESRRFTLSEKRKLSEQITQLPPQCISQVITIMLERESESVSMSSTAVDFDLSRLKPTTLQALVEYVAAVEECIAQRGTVPLTGLPPTALRGAGAGAGAGGGSGGSGAGAPVAPSLAPGQLSEAMRTVSVSDGKANGFLAADGLPPVPPALPFGPSFPSLELSSRSRDNGRVDGGAGVSGYGSGSWQAQPKHAKRTRSTALSSTELEPFPPAGSGSFVAPPLANGGPFAGSSNDNGNFFGVGNRSFSRQLSLPALPDLIFPSISELITNELTPGSAPPALRVESSSIWRCPVCTIDNKEDDAVCVICDGPRPVVGSSTRPTADRVIRIHVSVDNASGAGVGSGIFSPSAGEYLPYID